MIMVWWSKNMETLITTPHNFVWRVKNPQDYWANTRKEVKCTVEINGIELLWRKQDV